MSEAVTVNKKLSKQTVLDMEKWRKLVEGWDGKEKQRTYCERLGVSLNTFVYVRSKLRLKKKNSHKRNKFASFVPVVISPTPKEHQTENRNFILENTRGLKLHVPASLSLEELNKLFTLAGW